MKWLISYQGRNHDRYSPSVGDNYWDDDFFELTDQHPIKFLVEQRAKYRHWERSTWEDRPADCGISWRVTEVLRIYSAIPVPDDVQLTEEELDLLS